MCYLSFLCPVYRPLVLATGIFISQSCWFALVSGFNSQAGNFKNNIVFWPLKFFTGSFAWTYWYISMHHVRWFKFCTIFLGCFFMAMNLNFIWKSLSLIFGTVSNRSFWKSFLLMKHSSLDQTKLIVFMTTIFNQKKTKGMP
jgi:hypothetical protein